VACALVEEWLDPQPLIASASSKVARVITRPRGCDALVVRFLSLPSCLVLVSLR
jgi:hypothetical protein